MGILAFVDWVRDEHSDDCEGVENWGTWPVKRVLAELGFGVPGAMFLGRINGLLLNDFLARLHAIACSLAARNATN